MKIEDAIGYLDQEYCKKIYLFSFTDINEKEHNLILINKKHWELLNEVSGASHVWFGIKKVSPTGKLYINQVSNVYSSDIDTREHALEEFNRLTYLSNKICQFTLKEELILTYDDYFPIL